jgi:uncharacterized protein (DUF433 family)
VGTVDEDVTRTPGVQGGAAVLRGTRTPVGSVVAQYRLYAGDLKEVMAAYPHLSELQIRAALAYYQQHQAEVDADEERNERAFETPLSA